ncbi:hypothetical protein DK846_06150 [Methanospirillum lacunae]|uniref:DUF4145 domain-containing protein n=2 Tax=Methanospirillum lacunae TaxID=668570 RepID=A0A2V2N7R3_9EURY|nr:hypothetical protein DK846_06150 [Methanospirillum lacunae]
MTFLSNISHFITSNQKSLIDWEPYFQRFTFSDIYKKCPRVYQSQYFGDNDYEWRLTEALKMAYLKNPTYAHSMIIAMIQEEIKPNDQLLQNNPFIEEVLSKGGTPINMIVPLSQSNKYIKISPLPNPFYEELVENICKTYNCGIYIATEILSRKLIENLVIDVLRKKYGTTRLDLYYITANRRFQPFSTLVNNFEINISDFHYIIPSLDRDFINKINKFRDSGNSAAHNLEFQGVKDKLDKNNLDLESVVKTLLRLLSSL